MLTESHSPALGGGSGLVDAARQPFDSDRARSQGVSALMAAMDPTSQRALRWTIAGELLERCSASRGFVASLHAEHAFGLSDFIGESLAPQASAYGFRVGRLDLRRMLDDPAAVDAVDVMMTRLTKPGSRWLWIFENTMALSLAATKTWQPLIRALTHHKAHLGDPIQVMFTGAPWQVEPILKAWRALSGLPVLAVHYACQADCLR